MSLDELASTPAPTFRRETVDARLRATIADGRPVVAAGSSCGLVAKSAEAGGADLIVVYSTGISRLRGLPTTIFGMPNEATLGMADEILNVVRDTPVICGIEACDPHYVRLPRLLDRVEAAGYSGIINFPTITMAEPESRNRQMREGVGFGFQRELDAVSIARERGLFTMSYVFLPEEAAAMADAGVDCVVTHVGGTSGGMDGFTEVSPLDVAVAGVNGMLEAARARRDDVLVLAHGGPFDIPENVETLYRETGAQGFVGASSVERIPIEQAVSSVISSFKAQRLELAGKSG
ncbi:phosphoenolpyruvate hydrolase family protein [Conexibacter sp. CPCC 206217]|uniref:phosphoenolpyruvate hydrolase family protein n=1 Tax=Conexibacter sp. CPCC 206217 TaxID=3064574 RepID=UPI002727F9BA|nr:phosphoenolpyruvate hydrolase family protein [Conexibacter sp. CPCC 206217]MDO8213559.1 phosphoenolpyruvate hydrolase family protein [Conexibacter sp. CPCC 206217]